MHRVRRELKAIYCDMISAGKCKMHQINLNKLLTIEFITKIRILFEQMYRNLVEPRDIHKNITVRVATVPRGC